jgi:ATP-independent RNA helicase DbpA
LSQTDFSSLQLPAGLLDNLPSLGYSTMTPIQAESLPPILAGRDVIAQSKTGSGKTAAFGLGLLAKLDVHRYCVQGLVLCPTRELADQVAKEIRRLARATKNVKVLTLCGGMPFRDQADSLQHGAHIIVGTPGRIEDHLRKGTLDFGDVDTLVLDEADRMLEMGFQEVLEIIIGHTPPTRQTLLFSATYPEQIQDVAANVMREPIVTRAEQEHSDGTIDQHFYRVDSDTQRLPALRLLLLKNRPESAVVFCSTKKEVQEIADELRGYGFSVLALHGDLEQRDRDKTLVRFANKSAAVLVATDVAARGLDIDTLDAVINYQLARDPEVHTHRIGRTGRAGSKGAAHTLSTPKEAYKLERLQNYLGRTIVNEALPPFSFLEQRPDKPNMTTLQIDGGKKQKLRPGDILGALTGASGIAGNQVGKIHIFDNRAFVAVRCEVAGAAVRKLTEDKLKGRSFRVRKLGG